MCVDNHALADVRSTAARIKCLHCRSSIILMCFLRQFGMLGPHVVHMFAINVQLIIIWICVVLSDFKLDFSVQILPLSSELVQVGE